MCIGLTRSRVKALVMGSQPEPLTSIAPALLSGTIRVQHQVLAWSERTRAPHVHLAYIIGKQTIIFHAY
jgi:hypothetical protein